MGPSRIPLETPGALYVASLADMALDGSPNRPDKVDLVVCLVERDELEPYPRYTQWVETSPDVIHFPIADHAVEPVEKTLEVGAKIANALQDSQNVVVHCYAGFGRSSLIVTATMVQLGYDAATALRVLRAARPQAGPESAVQRAHIAELEKFKP